MKYNGYIRPAVSMGKINMQQRLFKLLYRSDLCGTRFLLGFAELLWAITLTWPGETFGRPTYHGMQGIMTENAWGALFFVTCFCQWFLLIKEEYHTKRAVIFALINTALWTFCVISMYLSVYPPPAAISGELALALGAAWIFVRSGWPCATCDSPLRRSGDGSK